MTPTDPKRIEDLRHDVEAAEDETAQAEEARDDALARPEGQLWVDSGTVRPDLDDQTIAPG